MSGHMVLALSFYSWCISGVQHHGCWLDQTHVWHSLNFSPHLLRVDSSCLLGHLSDAVSQEEVRGKAVFDSAYTCSTPLRRHCSAVTLPHITRDLEASVPLWKTLPECGVRVIQVGIFFASDCSEVQVLISHPHPPFFFSFQTCKDQSTFLGMW